MGATIKDIAAKTGLSITTISLVLNNKESRIAAKTKELILKTARELNYIPNQNAISLVTKESKTFGYIVTDIANPFFAELGKGISAKAAESGYNIILCDTEDSYELTMKFLHILVSQNVDGIILTLSDEIRDAKMKAVAAFLTDHPVPVVLIERTDPLLMSDCVIGNHFQGSYMAAAHLIGLGHRNFGCIAGPAHLDATKYRLKGFRQALEENGIPFRNELVAWGNYHIESGFAGARQLLETDPRITAIHAFNDMMAYGALEYLKERNIKVPEQISVVGFDDIFFSKILYVPLTSVALPIQEMGAHAVKLLTERVNKKDLARRVDLLEPKLAVRQSTAKPQKA